MLTLLLALIPLAHGPCDALKGAAPSPAPFAYDERLPLQLEDSLLRTTDGIAVHKISFASPKGGRASGFLLVPASSGSMPAVVLQHGMPSNAWDQMDRGMYIARHGAVVIAIDAAFARRAGSPVNGTVQDSIEQVQTIVDLRRAVDVLVSRGDVDASRIAYVGRSYGGAMGALLAGVEHRPKTYILAVADGGLVSHAGPVDETTSKEAAARWTRAMCPVEPLFYVGAATPHSILFQFATRDPLVPPPQARQVAAAASANTVKWYESDHPLNAQAYFDQLEWLHDRIGTRPPGAADLAGAPVGSPPVPRMRPRPAGTS